MQSLADKYFEKLKGATTSTMSKKLPGMDEMFDSGDDEIYGTMKGRFEDDFEDDFKEDDYTMRGARKRRRFSDDRDFSHGTFGESKVDKILTRYFNVDEKERQLNEEKSREKLKNHILETKSEIKRLSETIRQERTAIKFLNENKKANLIGLTNKKNLIFKINERQFKISPKGTIL